MSIVKDPMSLSARTGSRYPDPFKGPFSGRVKRALGDALGMQQFGVNLTILQPGAMSSLRHWHEREDECVYVLSGEVTLVTDEGAESLTAGMAAGFRAGERNGHHLVNRSPSR